MHVLDACAPNENNGNVLGFFLIRILTGHPHILLHCFDLHVYFAPQLLKMITFTKSMFIFNCIIISNTFL